MCQTLDDTPMEPAAAKILFKCKLVNPDKKSEFIIKKSHACKFQTMLEMESFLKDSFNELHKEQAEKLTFGYIVPGHGMKGRQEWITDDDDVKNMFDVYCKKKEVLLWCFLPVRRNAKRSKSEQDISHKKRKNNSTEGDNDSDDVATLVQRLKQEHGNAFSIE